MNGKFWKKKTNPQTLRQTFCKANWWLEPQWLWKGWPTPGSQSRHNLSWAFLTLLNRNSLTTSVADLTSLWLLRCIRFFFLEYISLTDHWLPSTKMLNCHVMASGTIAEVSPGVYEKRLNLLFCFFIFCYHETVSTLEHGLGVTQIYVPRGHSHSYLAPE